MDPTSNQPSNTDLANQVVGRYQNYNFYDLSNPDTKGAYDQMNSELGNIQPGLKWSPAPITNRDQFNQVFAQHDPATSLEWYKTYVKTDEALSAKESSAKSWVSTVYDDAKGLAKGVAAGAFDMVAALPATFEQASKAEDGDYSVGGYFKRLGKLAIGELGNAESDIASIGLAGADHAERVWDRMTQGGDSNQYWQDRFDHFKAKQQIDSFQQQVTKQAGFDASADSKMALNGTSQLAQVLLTAGAGEGVAGLTAKGAGDAVASQYSALYKAYASPEIMAANRSADTLLKAKTAANAADTSERIMAAGLPESFNTIGGSKWSFNTPERQAINEQVTSAQQVHDATMEALQTKMDSLKGRVGMSFAEAYKGQGLKYYYGKTLDSAMNAGQAVADASGVVKAWDGIKGYASEYRPSMADYLGKADSILSKTVIPAAGFAYGYSTGGLLKGIEYGAGIKIGDMALGKVFSGAGRLTADLTEMRTAKTTLEGDLQQAQKEMQPGARPLADVQKDHGASYSTLNDFKSQLSANEVKQAVAKVDAPEKLPGLQAAGAELKAQLKTQIDAHEVLSADLKNSQTADRVSLMQDKLKALNDSINSKQSALGSLNGNTLFQNRQLLTKAYNGISSAAGKSFDYIGKVTGSSYAIPGVGMVKYAGAGGVGLMGLNALDSHPDYTAKNAFIAGALGGALGKLVYTGSSLNRGSDFYRGKVYKLDSGDAAGGVGAVDVPPSPVKGPSVANEPLPTVKKVVVTGEKAVTAETHTALDHAEVNNGVLTSNAHPDNTVPHGTADTSVVIDPAKGVIPGLSRGGLKGVFVVDDKAALANEQLKDWVVHYDPVAKETLVAPKGVELPHSEGTLHPVPIGTGESVTATGYDDAVKQAMANPGKAEVEVASKGTPKTSLTDVHLVDTTSKPLIGKVQTTTLADGTIAHAEESSGGQLRAYFERGAPEGKEAGHISEASAKAGKDRGAGLIKQLLEGTGGIETDIKGVFTPTGKKSLLGPQVAIGDGSKVVPLNYFNRGMAKVGPEGKLLVDDGRLVFQDKDGVRQAVANLKENPQPKAITTKNNQSLADVVNKQKSKDIVKPEDLKRRAERNGGETPLLKSKAPVDWTHEDALEHIGNWPKEEGFSVFPAKGTHAELTNLKKSGLKPGYSTSRVNGKMIFGETDALNKAAAEGKIEQPVPIVHKS